MAKWKVIYDMAGMAAEQSTIVEADTQQEAWDKAAATWADDQRGWTEYENFSVEDVTPAYCTRLSDEEVAAALLDDAIKKSNDSIAKLAAALNLARAAKSLWFSELFQPMPDKWTADHARLYATIAQAIRDYEKEFGRL